MNINMMAKSINNRDLPSPATDNSRCRLRLGKYSEQSCIPQTGLGMHAVSDEGLYFVASSNSGTAFTTNLPTAWSDAFPTCVLQNNEAINDSYGRNYYLDYVRFVVASGTPTVNPLLYTVRADYISRLPNVNIGVVPNIQNANMDSSVTSRAKAWLGSGGTLQVPVASSFVRTFVALSKFRNGTPIPGDEFVIKFGAVDIGGSTGTTGGRFVSDAPPIILSPQTWLLVYLYGTSGGSFVHHFDMGWWER